MDWALTCPSYALKAALRCGMDCCNAAKKEENALNRKEHIMIFASIIAHLKDRLAKRARFRRMIDEINSLSNADLTDLRADRTDMLRSAYQEVYGH
ncbi:hypothetical protein [Labrys monachus]|uniref:DUF1127 domain-containing protein n=1 Tax=Labrys monachus TaxID=217067 RepID=A0ABU0FD52_9HYPH|nr:hypothetical protein [Labrys monachus]MDQ0392527.1 hypothetical protein [Labrys monachus]